MPQPENVTFTHHFSAWNGTESQFNRLMTLMAAQIHDLVPAHVEASTAADRRRLDAAREMLGQNLADFERAESVGDTFGADMRRASVEYAQREVERLQEVFDDARAAAEASALISMTLSSGSSVRETSGTPDELTVYLRGRDIDALSIKAPASRMPGYSISLSAGATKGVDLLVASTDDRWATAAFSYMRDEIARGKPWWAFARKWAPLFAATWAVSVVVLWNLGDAIAKLTTESGKFDSTIANWAVVLVIVGSFAAALFLADRAMTWLKAFDIVQDGIPARRGPLRLLLSGVGAIVLSVVANWISGLLFAPGA